MYWNQTFNNNRNCKIRNPFRKLEKDIVTFSLISPQRKDETSCKYKQSVENS